jgi:hypothetical protein
MGRCVADRDTGPHDANVAPDARLPDAFVRPDACEAMTLFVDSDRDGHGDPSRPTSGCAETDDLASVGDDCDDSMDARHPGATELCNGIDEDCDGAMDEGIQRLVGTPITLDASAVSRPIHVAAMGMSYVVAYQTAAAQVVQRFAADGRALSAPTPFLGAPSNAFLRVVPSDAIEGTLVTTTGSPAELRATQFRITTDPITLDASTSFGTTSSPVSTMAVHTGELTLIHYVDALYGSTFDSSLVRVTGPVRIDDLHDVPRSLHRLDSELILLETRGTQLEGVRLAQGTFAPLGRVVISAEGGIALVAHVAPDGASVVLDGTPTTFRALRFDAHDLATGMVSVTVEPFELEGTLGETLPAMTGSGAGAEVVLSVRDADSTSLAWRHFDRNGGVSGGTTEPASDIPYVSIARISSQQGAILYIAVNAGTATLSMQRVGCE